MKTTEVFNKNDCISGLGWFHKELIKISVAVIWKGSNQAWLTLDLLLTNS